MVFFQACVLALMLLYHVTGRPYDVTNSKQGHQIRIGIQPQSNVSAKQGSQSINISISQGFHTNNSAVPQPKRVDLLRHLAHEKVLLERVRRSGVLDHPCYIPKTYKTINAAKNLYSVQCYTLSPTGCMEGINHTGQAKCRTNKTFISQTTYYVTGCVCDV